MKRTRKNPTGKASYATYEKWYNRYASKTQMKTEKMTQREFLRWYRDAKEREKYITDPEDRRNFMRNFSQTLARKQRQASELQLHVTWTATKEQIKEFKKQRKLTEAALTKQAIRKEITGGKVPSGRKEIEAVEREVERRIKEGISKELKAAIRAEVDQKLAREINIIETYKDLTYKDFKKQQQEVLRDIEEIIGDRAIWNEAFAIYYERLLDKRDSA